MRIKLLILFLLVNYYGFSQTDNLKTIQYIEIYQNFINTSGSLNNKLNYSLEYGIQYDVFSVGINLGRSSIFTENREKMLFYYEVKTNLNVFQQGKFTNTVTIGIGDLMSSDINLLTEVSSGMEYSYSDKIHFNINFGQYFYSGNINSFNVTFLGISSTYYIK